MKQSHLPGRHQISAPSLGIHPPRVIPPSGFAGIFRTGFESSIALLAPDRFYDVGAFQNLTGIDATTGFAWPPNLGSGGTTDFAMTPNTAINASTLPNYQVNEIQAVIGHKGTTTNTLYSEQKLNQFGNTLKSQGGVSQIALTMKPLADVPKLYVSYWFKFQPNLATVMPIGNPFDQLRVLFEWKTGTLDGSDNGDYRVIIQVVTFMPNNDYAWQITGDDVAGTPPYDTTFWGPFYVAVPIATLIDWMKVEIYWNRANRFWFAINGTVILDRVGTLFPTVGTAPVNRIFLMNNYGANSYPMYQWMDDLEIWADFPPTTGNNPPYATH